MHTIFDKFPGFRLISPKQSHWSQQRLGRKGRGASTRWPGEARGSHGGLLWRCARAFPLARCGARTFFGPGRLPCSLPDEKGPTPFLRDFNTPRLLGVRRPSPPRSCPVASRSRSARPQALSSGTASRKRSRSARPDVLFCVLFRDRFLFSGGGVDAPRFSIMHALWLWKQRAAQYGHRSPGASS
jgi:hypothetical protein